MAQQTFNKHWPQGLNGANEMIPGATILQTRDGKDEPITLSASYQLAASGLFLPTDKDNPLETRVRELENLIGEIAASPTANTVQARLKTLADRLGEAVAEPDENTVLARIAQLETELTAIKTAMTDGSQKMQLSGHLRAIGDEQVTVGYDAVSLSPPQNASVAVVTVENADIRWRLGGDPTPTLGHIAEREDDLILSSAEDIAAFRAVSQSGIEAVLFVTYSEVV